MTLLVGFATGRYLLENAPGSHGLLMLKTLSPIVVGDLEDSLVMLGTYTLSTKLIPRPHPQVLRANSFKVI